MSFYPQESPIDSYGRLSSDIQDQMAEIKAKLMRLTTILNTIPMGDPYEDVVIEDIESAENILKDLERRDEDVNSILYSLEYESDKSVMMRR